MTKGCRPVPVFPERTLSIRGTRWVLTAHMAGVQRMTRPEKVGSKNHLRVLTQSRAVQGWDVDSSGDAGFSLKASKQSLLRSNCRVCEKKQSGRWF